MTVPALPKLIFYEEKADINKKAINSKPVADNT